VLLAVTIIVATNNSHTTASIVLGTIETVPLLWRRRRPLAVVVVVTAAALAIVALDVRLLPFQLAVALYTLASLSGTRNARLTGVASIAAITIALAATGYSQFGDSAARVVFLVAAWLLGDSVGSRRAYVREIEEKARRLEREREAETQRIVAEEQSRIARELHDVVAHALSVIVVQAAAADDVFEVEPRRAREPIRAIELAARAALGDLRRVLGIIQDGAEYEPQPGLARLDSLVEQVRATGLEVALEFEGAARPLPAAVVSPPYQICTGRWRTRSSTRTRSTRPRVRYGDELALESGRQHRRRQGQRQRPRQHAGASPCSAASTRPRPGGGYLVSARSIDPSLHPRPHRQGSRRSGFRLIVETRSDLESSARPGTAKQPSATREQAA
jgi:heme exporter protein D